jgi:guanylate kinase
MLDTARWDPVLSKLLETLEESRGNLPAPCDEELGFLSDLLQSRELHALVKVHNSISEKDDRFIPTLSNAVDVLEDVLDVIAPQAGEENPECLDLFELLQRPHIQGLLYSHDIIAQKDYLPKLPDLQPDEMPDPNDPEDTIKIVQLVKSNEPLEGARTAEPIVGATIKKDEETGKITIARVMHGGAADRSGLICAGDEVIEVNGLSVEGKTPDDVLQILKNSEGTITFKLVPADSGRYKRESKVRVRCLFDFDSKDDPHIPCKEAGLNFTKGDVLHIVSQEDLYWWQARREGDRTMRAGLIPSKALQERRIIMARTKDDDSEENEDYDREDIPTYEEVAKLYPRPGFFRPIILIGPPGVGRNELKRRLISVDPNKYTTTIPLTSRQQRPGEVDGKEYHFVDRHRMEEDIQTSKFIEFGEYKGNLYGTSCDSVRAILKSGHVGVLNPHCQALKMLRTAEFKPYIVYVKPPPFEVLKLSRHKAFAKSTFDESNSRAFNDDEFNEILRSADRIEFLYGHWFDEVLVNDDLNNAFERLLKIAKKVESDPLWVPAGWVQ